MKEGKNYMTFLKRLIREKERKGMSADEAYKAVSDDVKGIQRAMAQLRMDRCFSRNPEAAVYPYRDYIKNIGHKQDGIIYFPQFALNNPDLRGYLERRHIIRKAGSRTKLIERGIKVHSRPDSVIYYEIDAARL